MKNFLSLAFITLLFISCSKETDPTLVETEITGKWELIETTGQTPNSKLTGKEMSFQETYQFNSDGTFIKNRNEGGIILKVNGTFEITEEDDSQPKATTNLKLFHSKESSIIATCSEGYIEYLSVSNQRLKNSWNSCDGLGLVYMKKE